MKIVSLRAELSVLRAMCSKDKKIAGLVISHTDESYFHSKESMEIYTSIKNAFAKTGESPSYRLVIEDPDLSSEARAHFRDSEAVIRSEREADRAVRILSKYRKARGLYNIASFISDKLSESKLDVDALVDEVVKAFTQVQARKADSDAFLHFGKNNNSMATVKEILYGDLSDSVIPTGVEEFDKEAGGWARGSLVTIGATSGGGKSLVIQAILMFMAALGYKVVLVPLEMSKREQTARLLACVSGIDVTKILTQRLSDNEKKVVQAKYKKWVLRVKNAGGRYTVFRPDGDLTIEEIYSSINAFECDVSAIDYISLLAGMDGDDQWRRLGAAGRTGKVNAESTNRVNVLLCQVSEDLKIRYSRAINEHSTNSWVWSASKEEREKEVGIITLEQTKGRNNRVHPIRVGLRWHAMQIVNLSSEDVQASSSSSSSRESLPNLANISDI